VRIFRLHRMRTTRIVWASGQGTRPTGASRIRGGDDK
jgi:hypothetical protein